jgi:membrane-bound serine protease (ClpP class)
VPHLTAAAQHALRARRRVPAAFMLALGALGLLGLAAPGQATTHGTVGVTMVDGPITPVIRDHLDDAIRRSARDEHDAIVIRLNTPGGGLDVTREIANLLLEAPVPTIVYVSPSGGDAGSAGTFITYAAHIAAMAPATTIGAATPVDLEGGEVGGKIVENTVAFGQALAEFRDRDVDFIVDAIRTGRSVTADAALEAGAIDLIAPSVEQLLVDVDGREVIVGDTAVTLTTAGAVTVEIEMTRARSLLQVLANPNLAFIFLSLGTLAILYEIANPGLGLGGIAGVVMLILALFSLAVLPVNYAGAALLAVAVALYIAELFAPGIGVGAAGGTAALVLGGLFLFQTQTGIGIDLWVLVPTAVVTFGLVVLAGVLVARSRGMQSRAASDYLIGRQAVVERVSGGVGYGRLDGTLWRLRASEPAAGLAAGAHVEVVDRDNLELFVRAVDIPEAGAHVRTVDVAGAGTPTANDDATDTADHESEDTSLPTEDVSKEQT